MLGAFKELCTHLKKKLWKRLSRNWTCLKLRNNFIDNTRKCVSGLEYLTKISQAYFVVR